MKHDRFLHILRFLYFSDIMNQPNKNDNNYDRFWKMRTLFDQLNDSYAKFYSQSKCLGMNEVIVLFRNRVFF